MVGLGAIGVEVANAAHLLGMRVLGFDPQITVQRAWQLSSGVEQALSLDDLFSRCDMVTVHVPLLDGDAQPGERGAAAAACKANGVDSQFRPRRHRR